MASHQHLNKTKKLQVETGGQVGEWYNISALKTGKYNHKDADGVDKPEKDC